MAKTETVFPRIALGVPAIAKVTGIPLRSLYHLLDSTKGKGVPGAAKLGDRWALDTEVFFATFKSNSDSQPTA